MKIRFLHSYVAITVNSGHYIFVSVGYQEYGIRSVRTAAVIFPSSENVMFRKKFALSISKIVPLSISPHPV